MNETRTTSGLIPAGIRVKETLKNHEKLIRQLKDAWGDAAKGVETYAKESVDVLL